MVMKAAAHKPTPPATLTVPAGEFKAKCLQLMDEVLESDLTILVTKRGKPVAQVSAPASEAKPFRSVFGRTPGIRIPSDVEWKRLKGKLAAEWGDPAEKLARAEGIQVKRTPGKRSA